MRPRLTNPPRTYAATSELLRRLKAQQANGPGDPQLQRLIRTVHSQHEEARRQCLAAGLQVD